MYSRSEASFLQRQNSVQLFASIKGPTCGMEADHMHKVFIDYCCKTNIKVSADVTFLQYSTVDSALWHFSLSGFKIFLSENSMHVLNNFVFLQLFCNKPQ